MVSGILVPGHISPLFVGYGEAEHHGANCSSTVAVKEEMAGTRYIPKDTTKDPLLQ
jgi:hypothetical protein